jgi:peptidoglycan biosynthesis protein MviN/MurJ (putative lipid II flippase)
MAAARGLGDPSPEMRYSILKLVINVPLSVILVLRYGLAGVVAATLAASAISYGLLGISLVRRFHLIPLPRLVYLFGLPLLVSTVAVIGVGALMPDASGGWNHLLAALAVEGVFILSVLAALGYLQPILRGRKGEA